MEVLSSATSPFKRRKVNSSYDDDVALVSVTSPEISPEKSPEEASVEIRSTDLKTECFGTEISKPIIDRKLSGEKYSEEPKKSPRKPRKTAASIGRKTIAPPADEIEDFFSTAEKYEQKRFLEKYNFDVAKDAPLEGQYEWIRLKP